MANKPARTSWIGEVRREQGDADKATASQTRAYTTYYSHMRGNIVLNINCLFDVAGGVRLV